MPLDRLVERILGDAGNEAERIAEEGREEKEKILEEAYRKAEEKYGAGVREITAIVEQDRERALKAASLDARKELLEKKRQLMKDVFDRALLLMLDRPRTEYIEMLTGMAVVALGQLGEVEALVIMNGEDRREIGDKFLESVNERIAASGSAKPLRMSEENREMRGGFVLSAGRIEIDSSFDALVESRREELEDMVAGILFKNITL